MMLLLHVVTVVVAGTTVKAASGALGDSGSRALGWFWDTPQGEYPELQPAGELAGSKSVQPVEVLQEEGRRRGDNSVKPNRRPNKNLRDAVSESEESSSSSLISVNINKGVTVTGGGSGHNTPILPVFGKPIFVPGLPVVTPASQLKPVEPSGSLWNWDWITGIFTPSIWTKPTTSIDANIHGDVSINQENKPFGFWWPKPVLGNSVPTTTTYKPEVVEKVTKPSVTEVMVLRYPEFIKTIGQGIKKVTNAVHDFGFGVSESIVNKFQGLKSVPTALGAGVAAIIPLDDADKTTPKPGPGIFFPTPSLPTFPKPQLPVLPSLPTISKPNFGSLFNKPTGSLSLSGSGSLSVNSGDEAETHYGSNGPSQSTLFVNKFV